MMADTQERAEQPNIVLVVADDHGLDSGCYGNPVIQTPHMDALARDGVRFNYSFCTAASCSASRGVILSGLHTHANGQFGHEHTYHHFSAFDHVRSLPVLLGEAGYRTARVGKFHVGPERVFRFDHALPGNGRSPVQMADNCRDFIAGDASQPFFLYYCTNDPHRDGNYATDLPGAPNCFGNRPEGYPGVKTITYDPREVVVPPFLPDVLETRAELAQYYQSVSRLDQGIGRLTQILKETGRYDNTVIIYISDNGMAFPEAKTTLYDAGMRLPCIVRSPLHSRSSAVCNAMITWADLAPTLLDFAGATPRDYAFHGRSFKDALGQENPEGWDEVYASHCFHEITMYYPMRVARTRKRKFIWNIAHPLPYPFASDLWAAPTWKAVERHGLKVFGKRPVENYLQRPRYELYDLEADPYEVNNLAADPRHAGLVSQFEEKLKAFQQRTKDPWVVKWEHE
ncbi:MAG: sulfatase [Armatimonadetes bacterium]|nr:sulfatase [Armatimonadota bacterium]